MCCVFGGIILVFYMTLWRSIKSALGVEEENPAEWRLQTNP